MKLARRMDIARYRRLVSQAAPVVIETEADNDRALAAIEKLIQKGDGRRAEEEALLKLLSHLVEQFESRAYPIAASSPAEMTAFLLEQRGLKPIALAEVLGSRGRVSEILSGKRSVSKEQARRLADFFHVGVECFLA